MVESITFRSSHRTCSVRKNVFKNFSKFTGKHLCQILIELLTLDSNFIEKETLTQMSSCEFCEIFKKTFFIEHFSATATVCCFNTFKYITFPAKNISKIKHTFMGFYLKMRWRITMFDVSFLTKQLMNWMKSFSLVDWLWICFLNYKVSSFQSIKFSCNNNLCLQWICGAKLLIYFSEAFTVVLYFSIFSGNTYARVFSFYK